MKSHPYWWEDAGHPASTSRDSLPSEVDVVIVGVGHTGASAALTLARAGKSVLALDAMAPGEGASSRNGGMCGGGHRLSIAELEATFGKPRGHAMLREAHIDSAEFTEARMLEENIQCDYVQTGRFRGFWKKSEYDATARGLEDLRKIVPVESEMVPRSRQHEEVASELYKGGVIFPSHGGLNPAKLVNGLIEAAERTGAVIQGNAPVTGLDRAGNALTVNTPLGKVRCGEILVTTNGYTPAHLNHLKRRIIPVPSYLIATEVLGEQRIKQLFPNKRMIVETRDRHCYYRPSPDGTRIVFGGRAATFDVSLPFALRELRRLLRQIFPELKPVGLTHCWTGLTGFTFDFLPNVGKIDGIWHAMGYSGSGNSMAPYLGHKAALQILGDPDGDTAFSYSGFPTKWWHQGRPWFLPFADVVYRAKDIMADMRRSA